jgi:hypothetical protein
MDTLTCVDVQYVEFILGPNRTPQFLLAILPGTSASIGKKPLSKLGIYDAPLYGWYGPQSGLPDPCDMAAPPKHVLGPTGKIKPLIC